MTEHVLVEIGTDGHASVSVWPQGEQRPSAAGEWRVSAGRLKRLIRLLGALEQAREVTGMSLRSSLRHHALTDPLPPD